MKIYENISEAELAKLHKSKIKEQYELCKEIKAIKIELDKRYDNTNIKVKSIKSIISKWELEKYSHQRALYKINLHEGPEPDSYKPFEVHEKISNIIEDFLKDLYRIINTED